MVKVSVIMPAYNVENEIEQSVRSVINQTFRDLELIVVNDASTDRTWEKMVELKEQFGDQLHIINLEHNIRQGGARNVGIRESKGEYLTFVDSDDWIDSEMISDLYNLMEKNKADIVGTTDYYMAFAEKEKLVEGRCKTTLSGRFVEVKNKEDRDRLYLCAGGIWQNMYKKSILVENNIWFPEGLSYEDNYFVNLYFAYVKKYEFTMKPYYHYRQVRNSTLHRKDKTQMQRVVIEKALYNELNTRGLLPEVIDGYELSCIQRWYINTLGILFSYFGIEGLKDAKTAADEFREYFPKYRKNRYYKEYISVVDRAKLIAFEFSPKLLCVLYVIRQNR